ncbi:DUF397 domain-containing protein [Streptomyces sp. I05A-00742]|uniref:DUF397 domain-containing protein n=1 Tax=Streptomyces sp. I05A-00742 TaxID=2732853 RepID=UPI00148898BE|nr:DUF397 domain-containing protein [Streptomyces sp. I05A-00742]
MRTPRGIEWRKSTYSGGDADCLEATSGISGLVSIRDSKRPHSATLHFPTPTWRAFTEALGPAPTGGAERPPVHPART